MTPAAEKFRQQIQKELGLTIGPKDPLLALWVAQQEFLEKAAAEHQKLLSEFEAALGRNQIAWRGFPDFPGWHAYVVALAIRLRAHRNP